MARFRLSNDAANFLDRLSGFETAFDNYYFCVIAGLATGRSDELKSHEIVNYFVDDYKPVKHLLIGLLISAELKKSGISLSEKEAVRSKIKRLIDPASPTLLTDAGIQRMNSYADGGFLQIQEKLGGKPDTTSQFLVSFAEMMNNFFEDNKIFD